MKTKNRVMMLSVILALGAFLILGSFGAAGCSNALSGTTQAPGGLTSISMVNGTMGSSTQATLVSMSRLMNKYYPQVSWGVRTGASDLGPGLLTDGSITMAQAGPAHYIFLYGEGKEAQSRLKSIAMTMVTPSIVIANKDAPYDNLRDMPKGIAFCGGSPVGTDVIETALYMKALGWKKTDFKYSEAGKAQAAEAWRNGTIQTLMLDGGFPSPTLTDLAASKQGYKVLKVTEADLKSVAQEAQAKGLFVKEQQLLEDAPQQFTFNTWGFETPYFVAVRDDFPAEIAYNMAKIFDEHYAELVAGNPLTKRVTAAVLLKYAGGAFPLHPGVEKYFKEKGYLK